MRRCTQTRARKDERMKTRWTTLTLFAVAATVVLTGCATTRSWQTRETEQWLAAAGFRAEPADTQELDPTPPYRVESREEDRNNKRLDSNSGDQSQPRLSVEKKTR